MKLASMPKNTAECTHSDGTKSIFAWHVDVAVITDLLEKVPNSSIWKKNATSNNWFYASSEYYAGQGWDLTPLYAIKDKVVEEKVEETKSNRGITRIVLDVEWENLPDYYGTTSSADSDTIYPIIETLQETIDTVGIENDFAAKAVSVRWLSYAANVKHAPPMTIGSGKALHPILRESKGAIGEQASDDPKAKWPQWLQKAAFKAYNETTNEDGWFVYGLDCPQGTIEGWTSNGGIPFWKSEIMEQTEMWHLDETSQIKSLKGKWFRSTEEDYIEEGWVFPTKGDNDD